MAKKAPKKRQIIWRLSIASATFVLLLGGSFFTLNLLYPLQVPKIEVSTTVVAKNGEILRQFADENGVYRHWTQLNEVSPDYLKALIQYEDRYYYQHFGINPFSTIRALWQWAWHQRVISGSSTLTMQVARLLYPHDRTLRGKAEQAFRALQLELHYSKEEILTLYINLAPMGGNIEGVSAASQRYFSKKASELTLSESALLVALPQRPSIYRPDRNIDIARQARDKVLQRLYDFGEITKESWEMASQDPVNYLSGETPFYAPLLAERLRREYPEKHLIQSTIDYELQRHLERFLLDSSKRFPANVSAAIVVVDNHTKEVISYIGSVDLFDKNRAGFVDMVTAIRSPGSTLKPFAFGLALDYGIIHEASLLTDVPRSFDGYEPQNFDKKFRGRVPMYRALQQSLNVPVVQVFQHLTPYYFMKTLRDAGIGLYLESPTLSLILGGVGTTLEEQMKLFASLGSNGVVAPLRLVREESLESETDFLQDHDNDQTVNEPNAPALPETFLAENQGKALLSPEASWIITKILRGVSPPKRLNTRKIAWKTGTSYGYRDGWAFGVSPDWTVGVWVGRPDAVPNIGILAGDIAAPMLFDIFSFLPNDQMNFKKPYRVISETICWPSGRRKSQISMAECAQEFEIDTIAGKVPRTLYDAKGESPHDGWPKLLADDFLNQRGQEPINIDRQTYFNYMSRRDRAQNIEDFANVSSDQASSIMRLPAIYGVKIQTLADESIIFKSDYKIHLNAQGKRPFRWYLDGRLLSAPELDMNLIHAGIHRLSVLDEQGNSDQIQFEVRVID
ncbi:penicillin-binding protein 1C [Ignatzschineria rhizosphaerae]|uniref:peptidoglycan glycosyltransferase n=1 Tax=Ignatzschineria rhizosphaerae TaxID=2923279 RepID=A0ABY3X0I8_9GAMM|nr:penicillin-binding protein 1C [Ignatzschineria rhizosphaerae]UNM96403.1 penicillin-binding protein 1C [Ignatzschineria rhizosphaerae]